MASTTLRTAKRLILGHELRHMRDNAGMSQTEAARLIETRQTRIADLESGQARISPGDLLLLAKGYGVDDQGQIDALLELRRDNHRRGFWTTGYHRAYHEDFRLMVDLEQHADSVRSAQVEAMPGLAQCESYVRAMFAGRPDPSDDGVTAEEVVQARLVRQHILTTKHPPQYHVVMSESCLRREFGGPDVMREQLNHLIAIGRRSNVILQVMPFKAKPVGTKIIGNRFTLIRLPSPGAAGPLEIAYTEGEGDIRYLDDKKALMAHDNAWARLVSGALSPAESRRFIQEAMRELG